MGRPLVNEFSWSKSRHEKFKDCLRAYYNHYYGSWGGWNDSAPAEARELFVLKKLSNRFTWAGSAVHDAIRDVLLEIRAGRAVDGARVLARTRDQMRNDYQRSAKRAYRVQRLRKSFHGLAEHEFEEPVPAEEWKRNWDNVEQALSYFFRSRWLELARSLKPEQWLEVDEGPSSSFEWRGVRFYAIPDFAYLDDAGRPVIVDWKTGKSREGYDDQVLGYAVYVSERYRIPVEKVQAVLVYLNEGAEVPVTVDPAAVKRFEEHFLQSVESMRKLLGNPKANEPLPAGFFPMTDDLSQCAHCVFRRACGREGVKAAEASAPLSARQGSSTPGELS